MTVESVFLGLNEKLSYAAELDELLRAVSDAALELSGASHASVRMLDESGTVLLAGARSGEGADSTRPVVFFPGEGASGWTAAQGRVLLINDTDNDSRFKKVRNQGFQVGSILCAPIMDESGVLGVISTSTAQAGAFTAEQAGLLEFLGKAVSGYVSTARRRMSR